MQKQLEREQYIYIYIYIYVYIYVYMYKENKEQREHGIKENLVFLCAEPHSVQKKENKENH